MDRAAKCEIVEAFLDDTDAPDGCETWRDWIGSCLVAFLVDGEGFKGKRPLGESGWQSSLDAALKKHGIGVKDIANHLFWDGWSDDEMEIAQLGCARCGEQPEVCECTGGWLDPDYREEPER